MTNLLVSVLLKGYKITLNDRVYYNTKMEWHCGKPYYYAIINNFVVYIDTKAFKVRYVHRNDHSLKNDNVELVKPFLPVKRKRIDSKLRPSKIMWLRILYFGGVVQACVTTIEQKNQTHIFSCAERFFEVVLHEESNPSPLFTILTIGSRGDVQPFIALCLELMKFGYRARIATHKEYQDWVESFRIEFKEVKGDPNDLMKLCIEHGRMNYAFLKEAKLRFRPWIDELLLSAWESCKDADVLIEAPTCMAGVHIAEKLCIPYYSSIPMPWCRTYAYPHPFMTGHKPKFNLSTHFLIEKSLWYGTRGQINRWRRNVLDLRRIRKKPEQQKFLYCFSELIVPKPKDWLDNIDITGYWFLPEADTFTPTKELNDFMSVAPERTVYIGFGSIIVCDPDELIEKVIKALELYDLRAVMSVGWSTRSQRMTIEIPDRIFTVESIPHSWIFPKVACCLHHGGCGTTAASLKFGKPMVIFPFFGDQFFWADRVEKTNVGKRLKSLDDLGEVLHSVMDDKEIRNNTERMAEKIAEENGTGKAVDILRSDLGLKGQF